jgi:toxin CcdB
MARFDVYRNPGASSATVPFLLNVQSHLLDDLATRIVVPLRKVGTLGIVPAPALLMPQFVVEGIACILDTPQMAAVPSRALGAAFATLESEHGVIVAALDFLFQGF